MRIAVSGPIIDDDLGAPDSGMVIDFGDIKAILTKRVHDLYDHAFVVWDGDDLMLTALTPLLDDGYRIVVVPFIPTAENMAAAIFDELGPEFLAMGLHLERIEVYETPTSVAVVSA